MRPAIVLSGHTASLGVVRSLGIMGVPLVLIHYGTHDFAGRSRFVDVSLRAPHPALAQPEFIDFLLGCRSRFPDAVIFPGTDESLVAVSCHKRLLESHFLVACADWEVTRRCIEKKFTYALAENCGLAPRTLIPRSLEEALSHASEIGLPCLVKPCQSQPFADRFGQKVIRADSLGQLEKAVSMAMEAGLEVMIQELIPGDDTDVVNYNSYAWEGQSLVEFTAVHVRNGPPWVGSPRVVVSRMVPEVVEPGRRMLRELGFSGFACTEFKRDARDGKYKVLDVNGRHNLSTLLAVRCGINFPWLHYCHLTEGIAPQASGFREEVYWIDLVRDVTFTAMYLTREQCTLREYLRPYVKPHVFAVLDRNDLRPFLRRVLSTKVRTKIFGPSQSKETPFRSTRLPHTRFPEGPGQSPGNLPGETL